MNKLKTTIDDISLQKFLCAALAISAICGGLSHPEVRAIFEFSSSRNFKFIIFKFLATEIPYAMWAVLECAITVYFYLFFKKCIPNASDGIKTAIFSIVGLNVVSSFFDIFSDGESTVAMIIIVLGAIAELALSIMLIRNYEGQVKTMGKVFLTSLILLVVFVCFANDFIEELDFDSIGIFIFFYSCVAGLLVILPWLFFINMLKHNIEEEESTDDENELTIDE